MNSLPVTKPLWCCTQFMYMPHNPQVALQVKCALMWNMKNVENISSIFNLCEIIHKLWWTIVTNDLLTNLLLWLCETNMPKYRSMTVKILKRFFICFCCLLVIKWKVGTFNFLNKQYSDNNSRTIWISWVSTWAVQKY